MFDVDVAGLRRKFASRPKSFLVFELYQNAVDAPDSGEVVIQLTPIPNQPKCKLTVEDVSPEGFKYLSHAYTLFADSVKVDDPTKRGIWNLGEKLVLAFCEEAHITTTKGSVHFEKGKRRTSQHARTFGTKFDSIIRMTREEFEQTCRDVDRLLVPKGVEVYFNEKRLPYREPSHTFEAPLQTTIGDEDGNIRKSTRKAAVHLHKVAEGESAFIYELGIPVVELGGSDPFHIDVQQRVPLNMARDNVTPSYKRTLRALVLNETAEKLPDEDIQQPWVDDALEDARATADSAKRVVRARFGEKTTVRSIVDPESANRAVSHGYTLVPSKAFSKAAWEKVRESAAVPVSSSLFPTPKAYSTDPDAPVATFIPRKEWTPTVVAVAEYIERIGKLLLGFTPRVRLVKAGLGLVGAWAKKDSYSEIHLNVERLGPRWFENAVAGNLTSLNDLILHEFAHEYESNHLSSKYHDACTKLGSELTTLALKYPELFVLSDA